MYGDSGWLPIVFRQKLLIIRFWNRLLSMPDDILTPKKCSFMTAVNAIHVKIGRQIYKKDFK
jgi:hypothetical protein